MSDDAKPLVLLTSNLGGLRRLLEPQYTVITAPEDIKAFVAGEGRKARALVTTGSRPVDPDLAALPDFGMVAVVGSGYEEIDVAGLRANGVDLSYSPNANHDDVADHAIGLMISEVRKLVRGDQTVRAGDWVKDRHAPPTRSIKALKIGIVGLGAIGLAIAQRLEPFGCAIAWWGRHPKPDSAYPYVESVLALAEQSDVLMVAHRANDENKGLISADVIAALGSRGVLVNISRGSAVDEEALIVALKSGALGGAALDVFETEPTPAERWRGVPNVVLTPHTAGGGQAGLAAMMELTLENLRCHFAGEPLATPIP